MTYWNFNVLDNIINIIELYSAKSLPLHQIYLYGVKRFNNRV